MERSKTLRVRVNENELKLLEALADFEERKLSESVREAIREAGERRGLLIGQPIKQGVSYGQPA